jgi:hypothetical protein
MIELAEKMEQEKQFKQAELNKGVRKENQPSVRRKRKMQINFHNPNAEEDVTRYLINLVVRYLEEGGNGTEESI